MSRFHGPLSEELYMRPEEIAAVAAYHGVSEGTIRGWCLLYFLLHRGRLRVLRQDGNSLIDVDEYEGTNVR